MRLGRRDGAWREGGVLGRNMRPAPKTPPSSMPSSAALLTSSRLMPFCCPARMRTGWATARFSVTLSTPPNAAPTSALATSRAAVDEMAMLSVSPSAMMPSAAAPAATSEMPNVGPVSTIPATITVALAAISVQSRSFALSISSARSSRALAMDRADFGRSFSHPFSPLPT
ncbi:hypothetical protein STAL104432_29690 [Streptomyces albus]